MTLLITNDKVKRKMALSLREMIRKEVSEYTTAVKQVEQTFKRAPDNPGRTTQTETDITEHSQSANEASIVGHVKKELPDYDEMATNDEQGYHQSVEAASYSGAEREPEHFDVDCETIKTEQEFESDDELIFQDSVEHSHMRVGPYPVSEPQSLVVDCETIKTEHESVCESDADPELNSSVHDGMLADCSRDSLDLGDGVSSRGDAAVVGKVLLRIDVDDQLCGADVKMEPEDSMIQHWEVDNTGNLNMTGTSTATVCPPETDEDHFIITKNKQSSSTEKEQRSTRKKTPFKCRYMCTICRTVFEEQSALAAHQNVHKGKKLFKCKKCDFVFVNLDELTVHEEFHCEKRFKCEFCDMAFPRRRDIDSHILTHTGERPYKCQHCTKDFRTKAACTKHEYQHSNLKFQCETCGVKFAIKNELVKHIPEAHGQKGFQCRTCGKGFNKRARLLEHQRVHTEGKNPHKCEICEKSFSTQSYLRLHRKGHVGGQSFECGTCGKVFEKKRALAGHELIHTGERKFKCEVCGMAFSKKHGYNVHMLIHTGEKPYKCRFCGKDFRHKAGVRSHEKICKIKPEETLALQNAEETEVEVTPNHGMETEAEVEETEAEVTLHIKPG
ncbi:zinc finger protein 502-like [Lineus longissimus]|uniref:zinc finger protein 502-like n=1 Tax=Lineus longissimus TaxID=88925 RepID=UPI00315C7723